MDGWMDKFADTEGSHSFAIIRQPRKISTLPLRAREKPSIVALFLTIDQRDLGFFELPIVGGSKNCPFDCRKSGSPKSLQRLSHHEIGEILDFSMCP